MPISHSPLFSPPSAGIRPSPLASRHTGLLPPVSQPDVIFLICLAFFCQLHTKTFFFQDWKIFLFIRLLNFMLILEGFQLFPALLWKIKWPRPNWLSSCYWHENSDHRYISTRRISPQYWLSDTGTKCVCGSLVDIVMITWADTLHILRSEHKTGHYSIKFWGFSTPAFSAKSEARFWSIT